VTEGVPVETFVDSLVKKLQYVSPNVGKPWNQADIHFVLRFMKPTQQRRAG